MDSNESVEDDWCILESKFMTHYMLPDYTISTRKYFYNENKCHEIMKFIGDKSKNFIIINRHVLSVMNS